MAKFIEKFIGFSVGPVIGALISFVTVPLTTYFIDPNEYGRASMFFLFQMIFGTFLFLGMDQAYTREYHVVDNKLKLFQNAVIIPLTLAFVVLVGTLALPHEVSGLLFGTPEEPFPAILFGVMLAFMVVERYILLSIRMRESALEYSLLNIFVKLGILTFTLLFVLFIRRDYLAVVYATVLGQISGDVYLVIRYRKLFAFRRFSPDRRLLTRMLKFGLPVVVATSLSSLLHYMDRLALYAWSSFYQIGIFTATLKIAAVVSLLQTSFTTFWVPTAYRWHENGKEIRYFRTVSDTVLLFMSLVMIAVLLFKDFITVILSSQYAEARYIVAFLCLPPVIFTVSETTCLGIVFSRKTYLSIWTGLIALIPNALLNIVLVPRFGAPGAAASTGCAYLFFFAARTFFSNRNGIRIPAWKHHLVLLILFAGAVMNAFPIKYILPVNLLLLVIVLIVQAGTIRQLMQIFKTRKKKEWDFS